MQLLLWRIIPFSVLWSIWRERNEKTFRDSSLSTKNLISMVSLRIAKWALVRKEFSNIRLHVILYYWEACIVIGSCDEKRLIHWSPPPLRVLKFNVDGAARGKTQFLQALAVCCGIDKVGSVAVAF